MDLLQLDHQLHRLRLIPSARLSYKMFHSMLNESPIPCHSINTLRLSFVAHIEEQVAVEEFMLGLEKELVASSS
jgi:hypothetical protein